MEKFKKLILCLYLFFEKTADIDMMIVKVQIKPQRLEISEITSYNYK